MRSRGMKLLGRIGEEGLRHALRHAFDGTRLLDLAGRCGLAPDAAKDDSRLVEEILDRFLEDAGSRDAVVEALALASATPALPRLPTTTEALAVAIDRLDDRDAGRALFLLGDDERPESAPVIAHLLTRLRKASARVAEGPKRVGLFVDVQNMYYAARQLEARLDFGALKAAATRDRRLIRAIAYVVQNRDVDQTGFVAMLQQRQYEVRRKDLKIRNDGSSKGDWDMEMALDILSMADGLDVVVLVSGDGDFAALVERTRSLGPEVEVYSFPGSTAKELIAAADRHIAIDDRLLMRVPAAADGSRRAPSQPVKSTNRPGSEPSKDR